jgi:HK97 family phage major capsid protein
MDRIPHERFAGQVPIPAAIYRPVRVFGSDISPRETFGIGYYSLGAILDQEADGLRREETTIIAAIETAGGKRTDEQAERLAAIDARWGDPANGKGLTAEMAAEKRRVDRERLAPAATERAEEQMLDAAAGLPEPPTPFADLGEFMTTVRTSTIRAKQGAKADDRLLSIQNWHQTLAATQGANETVGSDGGYFVQTDISNDLQRRVYETGLLSRRARRIPVGPNANGIKINVVDERSRATGSRWGGVQVYRASEGDAATKSKPKFRQFEMSLEKLIGLFYATDEILQDTTALTAVAGEAFIDEFAFRVDDEMVRGTGAGQMLGILGADALVTVNAEAGQVADTVILENIEGMWTRMSPRSLASAEWFINQGLWPQIFALARIIGTGGVPVYIPAGGLSAAPFGTILGRPVVPVEQASAPGDLGDITFVDWSEYGVIDKGGVKTASSIHVEFLTDQEVFRWTLRNNGRPRWQTSLEPYKGSGTVSPFVALQAR